MLQQQELIDDIRLAFASLQAYIRPGGPLNLTDINVRAEDFVGELLNSVNGWNLSNTNAKTANYQCIDLIDTDNKLGVQVTSEKGAGKLNGTINCLSKHGMAMHIDKLKVFSLIPRQTSYAVKSTCPGVAFAWEADVLDFDGILRTITNISDLAHLQRIHNFVTKSLPTVFATRRAKLEVSCSQLRENLIVFDREVMWALEYQEDPVLMCRAIRQMRISLQTSGASKIANEIASKNFLATRKVLSDIEMEVKAKYPYIHQAAIQLPDGLALPFDEYKNDNYEESIRLMMGMRPQLKPLIQEIEDELQRLEGLL